MSEHLKARLKDMQARIAELEQQLAESQRTVQQHRLWAQQLRAGWPWKIVAGLRRLAGEVRMSGNGHAEPAAAPPAPEAFGDGPVAELRAALPPETRTGSGATGEGDVGRIDLARPIEAILGHAAVALLRSAASTSMHLQFATEAPAQLAVLCDSELARELAFDAGVTPIHEAEWRQQLVPDRFAFMLLENIASVDGREWKDALIGEGAARTEAGRMLAHCRAIGLPVVVWFREDVGGQDARAWLAGLADRVYIAEPSLLPHTVADVSGSGAARLPPAVQPALYNPLLPPTLVAAAARGRRNALLDKRSLPAAGEAAPPVPDVLRGRVMVTDSRSRADHGEETLIPVHAGDGEPGPLTPLDRIGIGRLSGVEVFPAATGAAGLATGPMQLQAAASGAVPVGPGVLRDQDAGIGAGETGGMAWGQAALAMLSDPLQRARRAHLALRAVLSGHCLADRLQTIADDLQLPLQFGLPSPRVACLLVTRRPHLLPACIERFRRDLHPHKELIVVVHGDPLDERQVYALAEPDEPVRFFHMDRRHHLGTCLNFAFAQTTADYWCKWDDDDFYGPNYLSDFLLYRRIVDFDLAGKPMVFTLLDESDELRWDPGWLARANLLRTCVDTRNTGVSGATLFGHRRVLEATPFPEHRQRGTDTEFLKRCHEQGWSLLSTDPFNFVRYRSEQEGFHTWQLGRDEITARTVRIGRRDDIAELAFL